ncbi:MAG: response regulator [Candidatus Latescibacteria bacterium]|nr:response regulator [Candidatus Latescibacterota bacterium]
MKAENTLPSNRKSGQKTIKISGTSKPENMLHNMFELWPDGFMLLSSDGRIRHCNESLARITGYDKTVLQTMRAGDLFTKEMSDAVLNSLWKQECRGADIRFGCLCTHKDNIRIPVELTATVIEQQNTRLVCVFVRDTAYEQKFKEENEKLKKQYNHSHAMETIGHLAGGISHYFNNVFTGIIGNLNLAEISTGDAFLPLIKKASTGAERARDFTRQLLSLSRKCDIVLEPIDMQELIADVETFARLTFDCRIKITVDIHEPLHNVLADAPSLHHVLLNMCVNARDAIEEKRLFHPDITEPSITIKANNVSLTDAYVSDHPEARKGEYVRISVADTGYGIDNDTIQHIFDPFFSTKEEGKGTGLGLSTAYETVSQHGGWIEVESEYGKGTIFTVFLPVTALKKKTDSMIKAGDLPKGSETVLFVDDEEMVRTFGVMTLERLGYTVFDASDGQEGLDIFIKESNNIDLIILDLILPVYSGAELLKKIRCIDNNVRVIITSGQEFEQNKRIFNELGALDYIIKPFNIHDLAFSVRNTLDRA